ncbi:peptidylprolyl isomerase [bacterium]|nr:MAG: peptidylprolyl isomerase [bacterium]
MAQAPATPTASGTVSGEGPKNGDEVAVMETAQGRIVLMFFPDKAPKHVASFKTLAKKGFFDGTAFHRVIPGFMIQGGDPNSDPKRASGPMGTGGPGYTVAAEPNDVKHVRGILSAARSQDRDSAGSQFFIMHAEYPSLDGEYDAYGKVVSGLEVVDKIVSLPTAGQDQPSDIDQARVKSVRIVKWPVK